MKDIEMAYRTRLLGVINMMFQFIIQKKDDKIIVIIYKKLVEFEPNEKRRAELLIFEADRHFKDEYIMLMSKMSAIDASLLTEPFNTRGKIAGKSPLFGLVV